MAEQQASRRAVRVWLPLPWFLLAAFSAYWGWGNPWGWWAELHPLFAFPLVVAPLLASAAIAVAPRIWLVVAGVVALVGVGGGWAWTVLNLPIGIEGAVFMVPPTYFVGLGLWVWALGASIATALAGDEARIQGRTTDWRTGWLGAAISGAAAWAILLLVAFIRDALRP